MKLSPPESWNQITVSQFIELKTLSPSEFDTSTGFQVERMCVLSGLSEDDIPEVDISELLTFNVKTAWSYRDPVGYSDNAGGLFFKGFKRLTIGEFIDLEFYFAKNYIEYLPNILSILYRKTKLGDWGEVIYEPLGCIDMKVRPVLMSKLPISGVYGVVGAYIAFRDEFMGNRKAVFGIDETDEDEDLGLEDFRTKQLKKWSWELFLYDLCNKDLSKLDQVTELNIYVAFNFAAMKLELKID